MRSLLAAIEALKQGHVIAYPTEAVFGLGCDPMQPQAIELLLSLKSRNPEKGLILIANDVESLSSFIDLSLIPKAQLDIILATWPGPFTWVFPVKTGVQKLLTGRFDTLAVRVTAHPIASELCRAMGGPIVSTSANLEGLPPARTVEEVGKYFGSRLLVVPGEVDTLAQPTQIRDALTMITLRF